MAIIVILNHIKKNSIDNAPIDIANSKGFICWYLYK